MISAVSSNKRINRRDGWMKRHKEYTRIYRRVVALALWEYIWENRCKSEIALHMIYSKAVYYDALIDNKDLLILLYFITIHTFFYRWKKKRWNFYWKCRVILCFLSFSFPKIFIAMLFDSLFTKVWAEGRKRDTGAKINYEAFLNETFAVDSAVAIFQACLILVLFSVERGWPETETWRVKNVYIPREQPRTLLKLANKISCNWDGVINVIERENYYY